MNCTHRESGSSILISELESRSILKWALKHSLSENVPRGISRDTAAREQIMIDKCRKDAEIIRTCISPKDKNNRFRICLHLAIPSRSCVFFWHNEKPSGTCKAGLWRTQGPSRYLRRKRILTLLRTAPLPDKRTQVELLRSHRRIVLASKLVLILWYKCRASNSSSVRTAAISFAYSERYTFGLISVCSPRLDLWTTESLASFGYLTLLSIHVSTYKTWGCTHSQSLCI